MMLHADLSRRVVVTPADYCWVDSPVAGVERMMLDRIGDEVGRASSLVRYAPNSEFPSHRHGGGEEILVLEGVFGDEQGRYPAGTYLRNPVGSEHSPVVGAEGATIFVKLHQFDPADERQVVLDTASAGWSAGLVEGLSVLPLHQYQAEQVALVRWAPFTRFQPHAHYGGEEILVLEGRFCDEHGEYPAGSWIRNPHMSRHTPFTRAEGALIYVKVGHLSE
ncbi:cupin domain-containing protein [Motiliproteus sediminis]|uniref:cupin domain-containing protein n=1 Tax=Motiliproteus sediminis TaxID=1468178 RepID=UPI001AF0027E|nr:cupin domain-containing protein [Motiliproteus sediminis]